MSHDDQIRTRFPEVRELVTLREYSTFRLGGPARYLLEATDTAQLIEALVFVRSEKLHYAILGGGSNTLIADSGFDGFVIIVKTGAIEFTGSRATTDAGVSLSLLLALAARQNLGGFDSLAGIPGTVGGAVYGNAGGRQHAIGDLVRQVTTLDNRQRPLGLDRASCAFAYRSSRFKKMHEPIIRVEFEFKPERRETVERRMRQLIQKKNESQPTTARTAGCVFTNIEVSPSVQLPPQLRDFVTEHQLPAWRLIVAAGLQGQRVGGARVSERHANFIIAEDAARAEDVVMLMSLIKQQVRDRFDIQLREEIQYLGFD